MFKIGKFAEQKDKPWLGYWAKSTTTGMYLRKNGKLEFSTGLLMESERDFPESGNFQTTEEIRQLLKANGWEPEPQELYCVFVCPGCGQPHFGSSEKERGGERVYCCHGNEWRNISSCGWKGRWEECFTHMIREEEEAMRKIWRG